MTIRHILLTSSLLTFFAASTAHASDADLRKTIENCYAAMKQAITAHDGQAIGALLAPNFTSVDVSGKITSGKEMIKDVTQLPPDPNKTSTTTLLAVTPGEHSALVEQRYDMKTKKTDANGNEKNVEILAISADQWIEADGHWLLQMSTTNQLDYLINGQNIMHKTASTK